MAHIVVADDDIEQVTVLKILLETLGHEVDTALSPIGTLRSIAGRTPDLVVMDLRFPTAAAGLALIRGIREAGCLQPLIVLSGWPDDLYGAPEERMVSRIVVKGNVRTLLQTIAELVAVTGGVTSAFPAP
jgi:CheY-like chemotaxis protein